MTFRADLRDTAVALLVAANTLAQDRVQSNRAADVTPEDMPFLGVYTGHEVKLLDTDGGTDPLYAATLTLNVDVRVESADLVAAETDLETLIGQVQEALLTAPAFYMPLRGARRVRKVSRIEIQSAVRDGDSFLGVAQIGLDIEYSDLFTPAIPDTLATVAITIKPNPPQAAPEPPAPATVTVAFAPS